MTDRRNTASCQSPVAADTAVASLRTRVPRRRARQGGFNFAEVLFAVMILGIGFIMIAAIFPVALQQTKLTGEEVNAASSGRSGVNFIQQVGKVSGNLPVTRSLQMIPANSTVTLPGAVYTFRDDRIALGPDGGMPLNAAGDPDGAGPLTAVDVRDRIWKEISGKLILPSDNRLAWVALYRRGATYTNSTAAALPEDDPGLVVSPSAFAQVFVIGVEVRNRSLYDAVKDLSRYDNTGTMVNLGAATTKPPATLEGRTVFFKLTEGNTNPDQIQFFTATGGTLEEPLAVEGAFIVVSDDVTNTAAGTAGNTTNGVSNGRIYRLGTKRDDLGVGIYELAPGWDMTYVNPNGVPGDADDRNENIPARSVLVSPAAGSPAVGIMVGRGYADQTKPFVSIAAPGAGYEGAAQDVAVYTSFVPAN